MINNTQKEGVMRIIILFCLMVFNHSVIADAVYKCQITDKQFVYQSLPCASQTNQKVLDIKKQTPEEIERSKQLIEQTKQERQVLDTQEKQRLESERIQQQAIIQKQQAEVIARQQAEAALNAQIQNNGVTITDYGYHPYYGGYPYYNGYSYNNRNTIVLPSNAHRINQHFPPYPSLGQKFPSSPIINQTPALPPPASSMRSAMPTGK